MRKAHFHFIQCDTHWRLWWSENPGDAFDVLPEINEHVLKFFRDNPSHFVEGFPEDDAGEIVCNLCK